MFRTARSRLALSLLAATAVSTIGGLALSGQAVAHEEDPPTTPPTAPADPSGDATFFVAALNGRNEVPGPPGSPAVGDQDGQAVQVVRIKGNQVSFALKWTGVAAPTANHIHLGAAGSNGAIKVDFFGGGLPGTVNAAVGSVTVKDKAVLDQIKENPTGFYANLHTAEFPGGAVRGQLHKSSRAIDLNAVLRGGPLSAQADGLQEVPGPKPAGDPDGRATAFLRGDGDKVNFSFNWAGIGAPTDGHVHEGVIGVNGPIALGLFAAPNGLPAAISGIAGTVAGVNGDLVRRINDGPEGFYANLHTAEFGGGAVRGQYFRTGADAAGGPEKSPFNLAVTRGEQIYACRQQPDGTFKFAQFNVNAALEGNVRHSFVKPGDGPPQWIAKDGSAVRGTKVLSRLDNGATNIAELEIEATQSGRRNGSFSNVATLHRLNTIGGVAPAGTCDPKSKPIVGVPYQADYLFITK